MNDKYKADLTNAKKAIYADAGRWLVNEMRQKGLTEFGILTSLISRLYDKKRVEQIIDDLLMGCYDNRCPTKLGSVRVLAEMLVDDLNDC